MERTIMFNARLLQPELGSVVDDGVLMYNHANPVFPPDLIGYAGVLNGEGAPSVTEPLSEDAVLDMDGLSLFPGFCDPGCVLLSDEELNSLSDGEKYLLAYRRAGNALMRGYMAIGVSDDVFSKASKSIGDQYLLWTPEMVLLNKEQVVLKAEELGYAVFSGVPAVGSVEEQIFIERAKEMKASGKQAVVLTNCRPEEDFDGMTPVVRVAVLLSMGGYSGAEALAAVSYNPAKVLGVEERAMVLKSDAEGNTVAVEGDPYEDVKVLSNIKLVSRGGRLTYSHTKALDRIRFALVPPGCPE